MQRLIQGLTLAYLALFAAVWGSVIYQIWSFTPNDDRTVLTLSDPVLIVAGFLAASVGAGLAAVLGIEMQRVRRYHPDATLTRAFSSAGSDRYLSIGIVVYLLVGLGVLGIWLYRPEVSPDLIKIYALSFFGWFAGAFAAAVKAGTPSP